MKEQKKEIVLIGIEAGREDALSKEALQCFLNCDVMIGSEHMLVEIYEKNDLGEKSFLCSCDAMEIKQYLEEHSELKKVVIVLEENSFYEDAKMFVDVIENDVIRIIPEISVASYFASRLKMTWDDMKITSIHGRQTGLIRTIATNYKTFFLSSGKEVMKMFGESLLLYGMKDVTVYIGEHISNEQESIIKVKPEELSNQEWESLCAVLVVNEFYNQGSTWHLPDEVFVQGEIPIIKEEVRTASIAKLQLTRGAIVYNIGAGTGVVAVEIALQYPDIIVYAIERKEEAIALIEQNRRKFLATNVEIIPGSAPQSVLGLPIPTHVYISGSSGNLASIVRVILQKNPMCRIVINVTALENLSTTLELLRKWKDVELEVISIQGPKEKRLSSARCMTEQNSIYMITLQGREAKHNRING